MMVDEEETPRRKVELAREEDLKAAVDTFGILSSFGRMAPPEITVKQKQVDLCVRATLTLRAGLRGPSQKEEYLWRKLALFQTFRPTEVPAIWPETSERVLICVSMARLRSRSKRRDHNSCIKNCL